MIEEFVEQILFTAHGLMAPFYISLIVALGVLFIEFLAIPSGDVGGAAHAIAGGAAFGEEDAILDALSLTDITLMGSLILIVVYSGCAIFRIAHPHRRI